MGPILHFRDILFDHLDHFGEVGDHRPALTRRHLEEATHVDVAARQGGRGADHGFADAGRKRIEQNHKAGHAGNGRHQKEGAPAMLEQTAQGNCKIQNEVCHDGYSSDCMAWRGMTRMARNPG